ncbi:hypothetical protein LTS18_008643, partial [Coniosporium uncinatum]
MASEGVSNDVLSLLTEIRDGLKSLKQEHVMLSSSVDAINGRVNTLAGIKDVHDAAAVDKPKQPHQNGGFKEEKDIKSPPVDTSASERPTSASPSLIDAPARRSSTSTKIILTSYPGQAGVDPIIMNWGSKDPTERGPVVVSRHPSTIRKRNAIGAHGGSYSIYHALAVASKQLEVDHKPDFTNTEPAATIGPFPQWSDPKKIVAMDPLGHLAPWLYNEYITKEG